MGYVLIGLIKYPIAACYVHVCHESLCPRGKAVNLGVECVGLKEYLVVFV
jgi:hypothetical protein